MEERITYHINENIINPDYVGVITTPMDDNFVFEDFREIPKVITQIDAYIRENEDLDYTVLDCRSETTLSTVMYSLYGIESETDFFRTGAADYAADRYTPVQL